MEANVLTDALKGKIQTHGFSVAESRWDAILFVVADPAKPEEYTGLICSMVGCTLVTPAKFLAKYSPEISFKGAARKHVLHLCGLSREAQAVGRRH